MLVLGPVAIKFAIGKRGRRCNLYEANLYNAVSPQRRDMLCPVLWCSQNGAVLIARSAIPLTEDECHHLKDADAFPEWDYVPSNDIKELLNIRHPIGDGSIRTNLWLLIIQRRLYFQKIET